MDTATLLVAVDASQMANVVCGEAATLAKRLGASVVLLHVLPLAPAVDPDVLRNPTAHPAAAQELREQEQSVVPFLKGLAATFRQAGVPVSLTVAHGDPVAAILEVAQHTEAGLVLLGTHGRKGLLRIALGSVAEGVVRASNVPVVTIHPGAPPSTGVVAHHPIPLD